MDAAARIKLRIETLQVLNPGAGFSVITGLQMALQDIEQAPAAGDAAAPEILDLRARFAALQAENQTLMQRLSDEVVFGNSIARERDQLRAQLAAEAERRRAAMLTAPAPAPTAPPPEPDVMLGQPHKVEGAQENQVQNPRAPGQVESEPADASTNDAEAEEPLRVWTPERDAKLQALRAEDLSWSEICAEMNKLPGPAVSTGNACQLRHSKLRMRANNPPRPPAPEKPSPVWTEERNALLRTAYTAGTRMADIVAQLSKLPGFPIAGDQAVYAQANKLGLARGSLPSPVPTEAATPTREDRLDHAKRLRRDGYAAAAIAARTGLSMAEITDLYDQAMEEARIMLKGASDSEAISQACGLPAQAVAQLRGELAAAKTRAEALILLKNGASDDAVRQETGLKPREIIALRAELRPSMRAAAQ